MSKRPKPLSVCGSGVAGWQGRRACRPTCSSMTQRSSPSPSASRLRAKSCSPCRASARSKCPALARGSSMSSGAARQPCRCRPHPRWRPELTRPGPKGPPAAVPRSSSFSATALAPGPPGRPGGALLRPPVRAPVVVVRGLRSSQRLQHLEQPRPTDEVDRRLGGPRCDPAGQALPRAEAELDADAGSTHSRHEPNICRATAAMPPYRPNPDNRRPGPNPSGHPGWAGPCQWCTNRKMAGHGGTLDALSVTRYTDSRMSEWYSIEVFDGASSAARWAEAHGDVLLESALTAGARDWTWQHHSWGVILEVEFADTRSWDLWRALAHVQAALEAVPDPISGLIVYRGRGGSSGRSRPRRPHPLIG